MKDNRIIKKKKKKKKKKKRADQQFLVLPQPQQTDFFENLMFPQNTLVFWASDLKSRLLTEGQNFKDWPRKNRPFSKLLSWYE